ncbi:CoB--CoM heterodisulfide reductase subunit B [Methanohalophilus sp.]
MMKISLFLGCLVPNRYPGIEKATGICLETLGIDWKELEGASCCPAPGVFRSFDEPTWLALASRNITLSQTDERDVLTICNGCYGSLADANLKLKNNPALKEQTNSHLSQIGRHFDGTVDVRHIIEFLYSEIGVQKIQEKIVRPLDLKVAVHYGCHMLKPSSSRATASVEHPSIFDELVEALGCTSVDYPDKMECCGAGGGVRSALGETALAITEHKLGKIEEAGVDCIVEACPFCHMQFDAGQVSLAEKGREFGIPVIHYSQLLALSLGYSAEDVGINLNEMDCSDFCNLLGK